VLGVEILTLVFFGGVDPAACDVANQKEHF
jgi:predicted aconitase with swiveling domain